MEFRKYISDKARKGLISLILGLCCYMLSAQEFRLAPPQIRAASAFFTKPCEVRLEMALDGVRIYYTLDGSTPDRHSRQYKGPIRIKKSLHLRAVAVHPDFLDSDVASAEFIRLKPDPDFKPLTLEPAPGEKYKAEGLSTLFDKRPGATHFSGGGWLGFNQDTTVTISGQWKKQRRIKRITVRGCVDGNAWIYPPRAVRVRASKNNRDWREFSLDLTSAEGIPQPRPFSATLEMEGQWKYIQIAVRPFGPLPDEHPGKGMPAWLFLEEVVVE